MSTITINNFQTAGTQIQSADFIPLWQTATGSTRSVTLANSGLLSATGGGTVSGDVEFTGAVTIDPLNKNVIISPTGTGTVTINPVGALTISPTAASTINNTSIGVTTPLAGKFTTLQATGAVTLSPASANVVLSPTGTGVVTINPATAGTLNNVVIGGSTPLAITGTAITAGTGVTTPAVTTASGSLALNSSAGTGITVTGGTNPIIAGTGSQLQILAGSQLLLQSAGSNSIFLQTNSGVSAIQVEISHTATPTNRLQLTGGTSPSIGTSGGSLIAASAGATVLTMSIASAKANVTWNAQPTSSAGLAAGTLYQGAANAAFFA